ncbi:MAG: head GIN domain-containing protein [Bacteroidaceae bacterium]
MKNILSFSTFLVLLFIFSGCNANAVVSSKNYITKQLPTPSDFHAIEIEGSADVEYRQSSSGELGIRIYGSDNVIELLDIKVINGTLHISFKDHVSITGESKLIVFVTSPRLEQVEITGSGDVDLKGTMRGEKLNVFITGSGDVKSDDLLYKEVNTAITGSGDVDLCVLKSNFVKAQISGSGDIDLKGSTEKLELIIGGSGEIEAERLIANVVKASLSGSGDIACYASKQINADVAGSGEITFKGRPAIENCSGQIKQITRK